MTHSGESDSWWRVRFVIDNQVREYTETRPGNALDKLVAEFGQIENQLTTAGPAPSGMNVRLTSVRKL